LEQLLDLFAKSQVSSSLGDERLKRLGTLLSKEKASLSKGELKEKLRLQESWKHERLYLVEPFGFWLDWWRDERGERTALKTWAAKQFVSEIANQMFAALRKGVEVADPFFEANHDSLPFYFDSDLCRVGSARDAGFSADAVGIKSNYRPLLELLAFVAFQRFRPAETDGSLIYCTWCAPLPPLAAAVAASGAIATPGAARHSFRLFHRTKYMKAFLPSNHIKGV
jgi:CRISPR-associated protein Csb3